MTETESGKEKAGNHSTGVTLLNHLNDEIYGFSVKKMIGSADSGMIIAL